MQAVILCSKTMVLVHMVFCATKNSAGPGNEAMRVMNFIKWPV